MSKISRISLVKSERLSQFREQNGYSKSHGYRRKNNGKLNRVAQLEYHNPKTFIIENDGKVTKKEWWQADQPKMSSGEIAISSFLKRSNVVFEREKIFNGCINPVTFGDLRFDFFIPHLNLCIEFDGEQHLRKSKFFGDSRKAFKQRKFRDRIKEEFCESHKIDLLRISHNQMKSIPAILKQRLGC